MLFIILYSIFVFSDETREDKKVLNPTVTIKQRISSPLNTVHSVVFVSLLSFRNILIAQHFLKIY
jgi:hypothetical protein